jgi:hypothetical protein
VTGTGEVGAEEALKDISHEHPADAKHVLMPDVVSLDKISRR